MKELVFPDINFDNLERWTGDVSPLECIHIKDETHNKKLYFQTKERRLVSVFSWTTYNSFFEY